MTVTVKRVMTANKMSSVTAARDIVAEMNSEEFAVLPGFQPREGHIYVRVRAISARINQNYDGFPSEELKRAYKTFLGKPCFVNHVNGDPNRRRGRVVASKYCEAGEDKYIDVFMEVNAKKFPLLAKEIIEAGIDAVSMGCSAERTICSFCGNTATGMFDMCEHVINHKGSKLRKMTASGPEDVLVYEECRDIGFFELSFVFDPADETALASKVLVANKQATKGLGDRVWCDMPGCRRWAIPGTEGHQEWVQANGEQRTYDYCCQGHRDQYERQFPDWLRSAAVRNAYKRRAIRQLVGYGEIEAPETYDTSYEYHDVSGVRAGLSRSEAASEGSVCDLLHAGVQEGDVGRGGSATDDPAGASRTAKAQAFGESEVWAAVVQEAVRQGDLSWLREESSRGDKLAKRALRELLSKSEASREARGGGRTSDPSARPQTGPAARRNEASGQARVRGDQGWEGSGKPGPEQLDVRAQVRDGTDARSAAGSGRRGPSPKHGAGRQQTGEPGAVVHDSVQGRTSGRPDRLRNEVPSRRGSGSSRVAWGEIEAPASVDTLRDDSEDAPEEFHQYVESPDFLNNPDLEKAQELDRRDELPEGFEEEPMEDDSMPSPTIEPPGTEPRNENLAPDPRNRPPSHRNEQSNTSRKGSTMSRDSLAQRGRVASRARVAEDKSRNDQGDREEEFITQTPPAEPVETGEGEDITNTEQNLVAQVRAGRAAEARLRSLRKRKARRRKQAADGKYYDPITEQYYDNDLGNGADRPAPNGYVWDPITEQYYKDDGTDEVLSRRKQAEAQGEVPEPKDVTAPDDREDLWEAPQETQPKDASRKKTSYRDFAAWVRRTQGKGLRQASSKGELLRWAGQFAKAAGLDVDTMYPIVKAEIMAHRKKAEDEGISTDKKADPEAVEEFIKDPGDADVDTKESRRRRAKTHTADSSLEVAAPDGRVDVERPTEDTTDEDAQQGQFDLDDFGDNAGDDIANPDLTTDQNWLPGEGKRSSKRTKLADGLQAVRLAEATITAGLDENREGRWNLAQKFERLPAGVVADRTALLERVIEVNNLGQRTAERKTAGNRGTSRKSTIPPNLMQATPQRREAAAEVGNPDSDMFL